MLRWMRWGKKSKTKSQSCVWCCGEWVRWWGGLGGEEKQSLCAESDGEVDGEVNEVGNKKQNKVSELSLPSSSVAA